MALQLQGVVVVNEVLLLAWDQEPQGGRMDHTTGPVVLVNLFEVSAEADEGSSRPGNAPATSSRPRTATGRSTALHRSLGPDADFRFVNVAERTSPAAFQAATGQPDFPSTDAVPRPYRVVTEERPPTDDLTGLNRGELTDLPDQ